MLEKPLLTSMVVACLIAIPVAAQEEDWEAVHVQAPELVTAAASPNCSLGVVYDDGVFNDAYSVGPGTAGLVMKFNLPAGTTGLDQVCACFTRDSAAPASMAFQVAVYNDNGPGGSPGTLLGTVNASASSIPIFPANQFYNVSLAGSGITLPDTNVYIGVLWPGSLSGSPILQCGDRSAATPQRTIYGSGNGGASWSTGLFPTAPPRAMGIRVDPAVSTATCVPSATAMCLNNNRFKVEAIFRTASAPVDVAHVFKLTEDTGYLWFFSAANVELVVKVLNGCGLNNQYWVFAGGLTNVEVTLIVTDTQTNVVNTYVNPLNRPFPPLLDTDGFATCP